MKIRVTQAHQRRERRSGGAGFLPKSGERLTNLEANFLGLNSDRSKTECRIQPCEISGCVRLFWVQTHRQTEGER